MSLKPCSSPGGYRTLLLQQRGHDEPTNRSIVCSPMWKRKGRSGGRCRSGRLSPAFGAQYCRHGGIAAQRLAGLSGSFGVCFEPLFSERASFCSPPPLRVVATPVFTACHLIVPTKKRGLCLLSGSDDGGHLIPVRARVVGRNVFCYHDLGFCQASVILPAGIIRFYLSRRSCFRAVSISHFATLCGGIGFLR